MTKGFPMLPNREDMTSLEYKYNVKFECCSWIVVDTIEGTVLCQGIKVMYPRGVLLVPIEFKSLAMVREWMLSGNFGELQEGLSNLHVGFSKEHFNAN